MFYSGKKALVTGGTGFIGSHFVNELLSKGADVIVPVHERPLRVGKGQVKEIKADLFSYEDCKQVIRDVDFVFHAAGPVGSAGVTPSTQMELIIQNILLAGNVLRAAWDNNIERLLLFGSSTGYPDFKHPVKEEEMWAGPTHPAYLGYGWMRRYLEKLAEFTTSRSSLKITIVRPTAVYGEWDDSQHVIPALIRRALDREDPFTLWGDGSEVRDFLHASDLARGSLMALEHCTQCDPINIGFGDTATIRQALDLILNFSKYENCNVIHDMTKPSTIPFRAVDISRASKILGFKPEISLEEGLKRAVDYYVGMR